MNSKKMRSRVSWAKQLIIMLIANQKWHVFDVTAHRVRPNLLCIRGNYLSCLSKWAVLSRIACRGVTFTHFESALSTQEADSIRQTLYDMQVMTIGYTMSWVPNVSLSNEILIVSSTQFRHHGKSGPGAYPFSILNIYFTFLRFSFLSDCFHFGQESHKASLLPGECIYWLWTGKWGVFSASAGCQVTSHEKSPKLSWSANSVWSSESRSKAKSLLTNFESIADTHDSTFEGD